MAMNFVNNENEDSKEDGPIIDYWKHESPITVDLFGKFKEIDGLRQPYEDRFVEDLRQFRGVYDESELARIGTTRSRIFVKVTHNKVRNYDARMIELVCPGSQAPAFGIQPTPIPQIPDYIVQQIAANMIAQTGQEPTRDDIERATMEDAMNRASRMQRLIKDQFAQAQSREVFANVIHSGNVFGTGILKGPVTKEVSKTVWQNIDGAWTPVLVPRVIPTMESVSIWDFYPDMSTPDPKQMRFVFQKHRMGRHELQSLAKTNETFNSEAILDYINGNPDGNAKLTKLDEDLRNMSSPSNEGYGSHTPDLTGRYDVLEYWGYYNVEDLIAAGIEDVDPDMGPEVSINCWMIDSIMIKCVISPISGFTIPYHLYYFEKDDTSIFGDGIPYHIRDAQEMVNSSTRAALDNMALTAGPIIEADMALLGDENPTDIYAGRVFLKDSSETYDSSEAIRPINVGNYTNQFLAMHEVAMNLADQVSSIPKSPVGDAQSMSGAHRTALGMSMLMASANITLKEQHARFEDALKELIRGYYNWNMNFHDDESVKGDFDVVAQGSSSLIAKEVKMESLNQLGQLLKDPEFGQLANKDKYLRLMEDLLDLKDEGLVKTPQEVAQIQQANAMAAQREEQRRDEEMRLKALSGGHAPIGVMPNEQPDQSVLEQ